MPKLGEAGTHIGNGAQRAWQAEDTSFVRRDLEVEEAARDIAKGVGVLMRLILEAIVVYALERGVTAAVTKLKASKLGAGFAAWVEANFGKLEAWYKARQRRGGGRPGDEAQGTSPRREPAKPKKIADDEAVRKKAQEEREVQKQASLKQRMDELSKDPQTGKINPKSVKEAEAIIEAENRNIVQDARRPDLKAGEPNLDFVVKDGYADIKTPEANPYRTLPQQASDIAKKSKLYDPSVKVVVDLKSISPTEKAQFKADLLSKVADASKIYFVND